MALKVLPAGGVRIGGDRLERLRREAQVVASLNHPRVAAIYGLEEAAGKLALVLELVEGEALDERLPTRRDHHGGSAPNGAADGGRAGGGA